ncbi:MAG: hypothetical protein FWE11_07230 [Defluviitaleaceae bacterium]|nr:hypothetical protein [Defluviitaleaceae bacterium]
MEYGELVGVVINASEGTSLMSYIHMIGSLMWMGLSAIAMIIFSVKNYKMSESYNKKTLKNRVFDRVFQKVIEDSLIKLADIIPAISDFNFDEFKDVLESFTVGIEVYKYHDKPFYEEIWDLVYKITDDIIKIENATSSSSKSKWFASLESHIQKIFDVIERYCTDLDAN